MGLKRQIFRREHYELNSPLIVRERPKLKLITDKKRLGMIYLPTELIGKKVCGIILYKSGKDMGELEWIQN